MNRSVPLFIAISWKYHCVHTSHGWNSGPPDTVVSDNGPAFLSEEDEIFKKTNGVKRMLVSPYHSASNGAAETAVRTMTVKIQKFERDTSTHKLPEYC